MSKRPKTANAVMSRLRRPVGRLRDLPIWSKLGLIMIVPTLATIVVGTTAWSTTSTTASNADRARPSRSCRRRPVTWSHNLQNERAAAVDAARRPSDRAAAEQYQRRRTTSQHAAVDAAKVPYAQQRAALDEAAGQRQHAARPARPATSRTCRHPQPGRQRQARARPRPIERLLRRCITDLLEHPRRRPRSSPVTPTLSDRHAGRRRGRPRQGVPVRSERDRRSTEVLDQGAFTADAAPRRSSPPRPASSRRCETLRRGRHRQPSSELFDQTVAGSDLRKATNLTGPARQRCSGAEHQRPSPFNRDQWDSGDGRPRRAVPRRSRRSSTPTIVDRRPPTLRDDVQRAGAPRDQPAARHAAAGHPVRLAGRPVDGPVAARAAPGRALGRPVRPAAGGRPAARPGAVQPALARRRSPTRSPSRCRCAAGTSSAR